MDIKTTLLCVAGALLLIGGVALDNTIDRLDKEKAKHHETQVAFKNFRDTAQKISENTSKHYEELLDAANQQANKELAAKDKALASATATSGRLQHTINDLRTRIDSSSCKAAKEYAAVSGELLGVCQRSLVWLSEQADGHRIDANRFEQAWPTNPESKPKGTIE